MSKRNTMKMKIKWKMKQRIIDNVGEMKINEIDRRNDKCQWNEMKW